MRVKSQYAKPRGAGGMGKTFFHTGALALASTAFMFYAWAGVAILPEAALVSDGFDVNVVRPDWAFLDSV